jgi:hypothetical protein
VAQRGLAGDVLFFTGAAALAAGVALVAIDAVRRRRAGEADGARSARRGLGLAPTIGPGAAGLGLSGVF